MIKDIRFKKLLALILFVCLFLPSLSPIQAVEMGQYVKNAETLQALGLFKGTTKGFELTKISTRAEAAVMLVRLLGAEELAKKEVGLHLHPFTDVPTWANPYVSYLYSRGLTKGISQTNYGTNMNVTGNQYTTMLLRALGYDDQAGIFNWSNAINFAGTMGLLNQQELDVLKPEANKGLLRDSMAKISYKSLFTNKMDTDTSLIKYLLDSDVISLENLGSAKQIDTTLARFVEQIETVPETTEMRAVWISYIELQGVFANKTADTFQSAIKTMFEKVKNMGLNTVIVQVRPFGDAIYPSGYFPWSYIISGKEGGNPGFDPLEIMVEEAHQQGLKFEAWINPFRVRSSSLKPALSGNNIANTWLKDGSNRVFQISDGIYYNPASADVRDLICNGVTELVDHYDVDSIQFDDYFYPSASLSYDQSDYNLYKEAGGEMTQQDWRRENNNLLVSSVYSAIKAHNPNVQFGISPQGSFEANYAQQFIDVEKWTSTPGYIDYIFPQMYYGFNNTKYPYAPTVEKWEQIMKLDSTKLYIGLSIYKIGTEDKYAGAGKLEWTNTQTIIQRMVEGAREKSHYSGFGLFRYEHVFKEKGDYYDEIKAEMDALKSIIQ